MSNNIQIVLVFRIPDRGRDTLRPGHSKVATAIQNLYEAVSQANTGAMDGNWHESHMDVETGQDRDYLSSGLRWMDVSESDAQKT